MNQRLGCLSPLALISAFAALLLLIGALLLFGGSIFSPGALHTSHADLDPACGDCHAPFWSAKHMTDYCLDCHTEIQTELGDRSTLHGALANQRNLRCQDCHTEHVGADGELTVMELTTFPHEVTGFTLTAHQTRLPGLTFVCQDCHTKRYTQLDPAICADCHGEMDPEYSAAHLLDFGVKCLDCHDGQDRFSQFDHSQTRFALAGKHAEAVCSACHQNARGLADLQGLSSACESCHMKDDAHTGRFGQQCGACHRSEGWRPAKFDHNLADFKLEGRHDAAACEQCHSDGLFKGTPKDCYSCHQKDDAHQGEYGTACEACHTVTDWKDVTFDHGLTQFPLNGAHVKVACTACHANNVFKGTSTACASCHREPDYHLGMFAGQACSQCHTTTAWRPAPYNGPHTFPMNHGGRGNTCADCHQPTLRTWTCYTCHNQAEIANEHAEEGIANFSNCLQCHPTGQEGDGGGGGDGGDDD